MDDNTLLFPAGSVFLLTQGDYSDYGHVGCFVARKECNLHSLATAFKAQFQPEHDWDTPGPEMFAAWLVTEGWAFPGEIQEVHIGGYSSLDIGANPPEDSPND